MAKSNMYTFKDGSTMDRSEWLKKKCSRCESIDDVKVFLPSVRYCKSCRDQLGYTDSGIQKTSKSKG